MAEAARKNPVIVVIKLHLNPINNKYFREIERYLNRNMLSIKNTVVPKLKTKIGGLGVNRNLHAYYDEQITEKKKIMNDV